MFVCAVKKILNDIYDPPKWPRHKLCAIWAASVCCRDSEEFAAKTVQSYSYFITFHCSLENIVIWIDVYSSYEFCHHIQFDVFRVEKSQESLGARSREYGGWVMQKSLPLPLDALLLLNCIMQPLQNLTYKSQVTLMHTKLFRELSKATCFKYSYC
jgi:hypothetical protein